MCACVFTTNATRLDRRADERDRMPANGQYLPAQDGHACNLQEFINKGDNRAVNRNNPQPIINPSLCGLTSKAAWQAVNHSCVLGDPNPDWKSKGVGWYVTGRTADVGRDPPTINSGKGHQPRAMMWMNRAPLDPAEQFERTELMRRLEHDYFKEVRNALRSAGR